MTNQGVSLILGGVVAMASGVASTQPTTSETTSLALLISGIGGVGTILGAILTFLARQRRAKVDEKVIDATADQQLRDHYSKEIGALREWSTQQDRRLDKVEADKRREAKLKHACNKAKQALQLKLDIAGHDIELLQEQLTAAKAEAEGWKLKFMELAVEVNKKEMNGNGE